VYAAPTDVYLEKHLTPYEQLGFDMGINLQIFDPGVYFSFVEAHVMEHGLYMLAGRGLYWLNHDLIEVQKDDFIYMAPFCPQFFYATGWDQSAYLLYKDVNRDYTQFL
jgi:(S)-ureidoglycine aminohydrolase